MKHVVTVKELQQLIPETRSLDGKNFKDMKQLIEFVIQAIEKSGGWSYVQYVSGNPSLFVVEQKEIKQTSKYDMVTEISNHYNPVPAPKTTTAYDNRAFAPAANNENKKTTKIKEKSEPKTISNTSVNEEKLFKNTKMPW